MIREDWLKLISPQTSSSMHAKRNNEKPVINNPSAATAVTCNSFRRYILSLFHSFSRFLSFYPPFNSPPAINPSATIRGSNCIINCECGVYTGRAHSYGEWVMYPALKASKKLPRNEYPVARVRN